MSEAKRPVPPAIPSATILLLREAASPPSGWQQDERARQGGPLEVFMVKRHHRIDFASNALVFPGGKVDPTDHDPGLHARCAGAAGLDPAALALRIAAVRETFEESGVLLARPQGAGALLPGAQAGAIEARWRDALNEDRATLGAIAAAEDLMLALDALVAFAHWITPEVLPKRFDTHFYLTAAPPDQVATHDGHESVDSLWIAPARALEEAAGGRLSIPFPTRMQLAKLARASSVADALDRARASRVVPVLPTVGRGADGPVLRIPAEADYDLVEAPIAELR